MGENFCGCRVEDARIIAGSGALLSRIAKAALEASLTGFEFAAGIPGSLGGAVVMNAGAYGSEMKCVLESARVMKPDGGTVALSGEELELGYRTSCVVSKEYIVCLLYTSSIIDIKKMNLVVYCLHSEKLKKI